MADLTFNCPNCRQSLEASDDMHGEPINCPACNANIQIPALQSKLPPPPPVAAVVRPDMTKVRNAVLVIGGVMCFAAVLIALSSSRGQTTTGLEATRKSENEHLAVASPNEALDPMATSAENDAPSPTTSALKTDAALPLSPRSETEWTSFSNAVAQGDVQVQIKCARVGKVQFRDMFGDINESRDDLLSITLCVSNLSTGKKINFSSWRGEIFSLGDRCALLSDDNTNTYKRINFGVSAKPEGGVERESIYPGKDLNDVLVFERPVDNAKWVHLVLPAANFEGEGTLRFEIPSGVIESAKPAALTNDSDIDGSQNLNGNSRVEIAKDHQSDYPAYPGERVVKNGIALTVTSMQSLGTIDGTEPGDGKTFLVVDVTIETTGRNEAPYNPMYFSVKDSRGYEYSASVVGPDNELQSGTLKRGATVRGLVAFKVPKTSRGFILKYEPVVILGNYEAIYVKLIR